MKKGVRPPFLGPLQLLGALALGLAGLVSPAHAQPEPADPAPIPGPAASEPAASAGADTGGAAAHGDDSSGARGVESADAAASGVRASAAADGAASIADGVPPPFAPWSTARLALELELISQARHANKAGANLSEVRLDRGELGARVALGPHGAAELRLETVRSALEGGALGIDGDSMVVRIRFANIGGSMQLGPVTLDGALGFVPDPWLRALEDGYPLRPLSRSGTERLLGWAPADLAAIVRAAVGPARLSISIGNGEGQRFPERNTGKTTTAVAEVVAVNQHAVRLSLAGMFRDGSIGVARVRDRRAGGGATLITPWVRAGVEAVKAWGIGERGEAEGLEVGGWAEGRIVDHVFVAARGSSLGFTAGGRLSTFGGAIAVEPWTDSARGRYRVWLAVDRVTASGGAMPLPGADPGDATVAMLVVSAVAPFVLD